jgi:hypothetical protein
VRGGRDKGRESEVGVRERERSRREGKETEGESKRGD